MKKVLVVVGAFVAAISVHAGTLLWQVTSQLTYNNENIGGAYLHVSDGTLSGQTKGERGSEALTVTFDSSLTDNLSFYVEFFNYSEQTIGFSDAATYADLLNSGSIAVGTMEVGKLVAWMPPPAMVPEPTSAMMMLLGVAFLGLKRRKA